MKWDELFNIVKDLEIGHSYKIYEENGFLIKNYKTYTGF